MPDSDGVVEDKMPVPGLGRAPAGDKSTAFGVRAGPPDHPQWLLYPSCTLALCHHLSFGKTNTVPVG